MITISDVAKENIKKQTEIATNSWSSIKNNNDWRLWITVSDDLITHQPDPNKTYWHIKGPYKSKNWFLINKRKSTGLKHSDHFKVFIEYWHDKDGI